MSRRFFIAEMWLQLALQNQPLPTLQWGALPPEPKLKLKFYPYKYFTQTSK
jgi:hypothetical protein